MTGGSNGTACMPSWWLGTTASTVEQVAEPVADERAQLDTARAPDSVTLHERAAIAAESAGVPRAWAEGYAALCAMPPPAGFWPDRWHGSSTRPAPFSTAGPARRSAAAGPILTCSAAIPTRPIARFDCMGLVLLLDRREVVAIDRGRRRPCDRDRRAPALPAPAAAARHGAAVGAPRMTRTRTGRGEGQILIGEASTGPMGDTQTISSPRI